MTILKTAITMIALTGSLVGKSFVVVDPCSKSDAHKKACQIFQQFIDCAQDYHESLQNVESEDTQATECDALQDELKEHFRQLHVDDQKLLAHHFINYIENEIE